LLVRSAKATAGIGERRSNARGPGMEFLDYREYQPGDDVRHLDPHLFARTGTHYVREYAVYQQLPITIIVDGSASMNFSAPSKFDVARGLASALAFVGLAGGDVVQVAVQARGRVVWAPPTRGVRRAPVIFDWLARQLPGGAGFGEAIASVLPRLRHRGVVILVSDWWVEERSLKVLGSLRQEFVIVHVVAPEELDPAHFGLGETRVVDAESGHEIELLIDERVLGDYGAALTVWQDNMRQRIGQYLGRYFMVRTDASLDKLLLQDWRRSGLIS
jgi:uncharacterized protein (DUF58 family)